MTATMIFHANIQPPERCGSGKRGSVFQGAARRLLHRSVWMREGSINFTVWLSPTTRYLELLSIRAISGYPVLLRSIQ
jgi:hypothetical protein